MPPGRHIPNRLLTNTLTLLIAIAAKAQVATPPAPNSSPLPKSAEQSKAAPPQRPRAVDPHLHVTKMTLGEQGISNTPAVDIEVVSTSPKIITAYAVSLVMHYASGPDWKTWESSDLIRQALTPQPDSPPRLPRGGVGHIHASARPDLEGQPASSATASIAAVIFDDRTALGDSAVIDQILAGRRTQSRECAAILQEIKAAQTEPQVLAALAGKDPNATLELKKAIVRRIVHSPADQSYKGARSKHDEALYHFSNILQAGLPYFDAELTRYKRLQQALTEQSTLVPHN